MSDTSADQGAQSSVAKAEIRPPRRFSIVWLIPLAVAAVAGWVAYSSISGQGPSITITFDTANGLEAGKTRIMFKGVQAGTVDSIGVSEDLQHVVVHASMAKATKDHLNDGTQFWVVRPEVSLTGISGLSTLVSGAYIAMQPGSGKPRRAFEGLKQAPPSLDKGNRFTLKAKLLGTLHVGSAVHHHGVVVGKVLSYELAKDDSGVEIQILIDKKYVHLVRENSLFWNFSGIHINLRDFYDPSVDVGSLASLLAGGIAFANPPEPADAAPADSVFELYRERPDVIKDEAAEEAGEFEVFLTAGDLSGVGEGDPVLYRGLEIGRVRETRINAAADGVKIRLGIYAAHAGLIRTDTVFWNASGARFNLGDLVDASVDIESLKALVAGGVALANPSAPGPRAESGAVYALQADRPDALFRKEEDLDALHIVLKSEVQGSVKVDDPILFREVEVGKVTDVELSGDASFVVLHVAIEPRYAPLVRSRSVFWNASGIHASFGIFSGADIDVESLSALLRGGIAFATPKDGGAAVADGATFALHSEAKKEWQAWAPHIRLLRHAAKKDGAAPPADAGSATSEAPDEQESAAGEPDAATSRESLPLPTAVALSGEHVSASVLSEALAKLGFTNIGNIQRSGAIVRVDADWDSETVKLHIDTKTGRIEAIR